MVNKKLTPPTTVNVVTIQVINEDGSLAEERTVTNKYMAQGFAMLSNGHNSGAPFTTDITYTASPAYMMYYNPTGFNAESGAVNNYTSRQAYGISHVFITDTVFDPPYNSLVSNNAITGNKLFGAANTLGYGYGMDTELDYMYDNRPHISNAFKYAFAYGTVNQTIRTIGLTSTDNATMTSVQGYYGVKSILVLDEPITVSATQRLQIIYRLLFDYTKYYNGNAPDNNLSLKDEYKNIIIDSGVMNADGVDIPYNVVIPYFLTNTPRFGTAANSFIRLFSCNFSKTNTTTTSNDVFYYNTNLTANLAVPYNSRTIGMGFNSTTTGMTKSCAYTYPATVPAYTGLYKIGISIFSNYGGISTDAQTLFIEFPTPWNKPADMTISYSIQWDEIWSQ